MVLALGSDHGGYALKEEVKKYLDSRGVAYHDFGCHSTDSCDYPVSVSYTHLTLPTTPYV